MVFDETQVGVHKGVNTRSDRTRTCQQDKKSRRDRVAKRLPAKTVWRGVRRKPAADVLRRPAASGRNRAKKGPRLNARWLWMAVTVGQGRVRHTHGNGTKKLTFAFLPKAEDAPNKKPRGLKAMEAVIKKHIKPKSFLVFDGWKSSKRATTNLGVRCAPPVNHSLGWRDAATGFHSNDVESENARLKLWLRARYTKLQLNFTTALRPEGQEDADRVLKVDFDCLDVYEYCHYVNVGASMSDVMSTIAVAGGGASRLRRAL